MQGQSLGQEDSPGGVYGNLLHYSTWRIPWKEEPGRLQSTGSQSDMTEATQHAQDEAQTEEG